MIVVGLISGTSVDGIDAVLTEITGDDLDIEVKLLAGETYSYPEELRSQILGVGGGDRISLEDLAELDDAIARQFAIAALEIQKKETPATLIGSHGQTVFHRPPSDNAIGYTLQLGRGDLIAQIAKIRTVSNFRVADIAAGGHGAPLVSRLDLALLSHAKEYRCVQNLGGIGNVTYLPPRLLQRENDIIGWDTGPANILIDLAVERFTDGRETYDRNGNWAAQGTPHHELVERWLQQDFFHLPPPQIHRTRTLWQRIFSAVFRRCRRKPKPSRLAGYPHRTDRRIRCPQLPRFSASFPRRSPHRRWRQS